MTELCLLDSATKLLSLMYSRYFLFVITVPKPLIPIAGKPIVQRLVEDIAGIPTHPSIGNNEK